jgi:hypothetical protein
MYSDSTFADVLVQHPEPAGGTEAEVIVGPAVFPIGFTMSGVVDDPASPMAQGSMFQAGSFYFWSAGGARPATTDDLRAFLERLVRRVGRRWQRRIERVLKEPIESVIAEKPKRRAAGEKPVVANLQPVRIVTDPDAPALQPQDVDRLYPWRQKDLMRELNTRIGRRMLNSYDIQAVRRQHRLDERPDFVFNLPGAGRRYSPAVAEWIMGEYARDPEFFRAARTADHEVMKLRRRKPK